MAEEESVGEGVQWRRLKTQPRGRPVGPGDSPLPLSTWVASRVVEAVQEI